MNRTNRRHTRQIERHRHNKGPELLCKAADNELQEKAGQMAESLSRATIEKGDTSAAGLLVALAEGANNEELAAAGRTFSLAEKWASEPQVAVLDTGPQLGGGVTRLALTDGRPAHGEAGSGESGDDSEEDGIVDAEFEMVPEGSESALLTQPGESASQQGAKFFRRVLK